MPAAPHVIVLKILKILEASFRFLPANAMSHRLDYLGLICSAHIAPPLCVTREPDPLHSNNSPSLTMRPFRIDASRVQLSHLSKPKEKNMSEHESRREFLKQAAVAGALAAAGCQSEKNGDKTVKNPTGGPATRPSTMPTANNKLNV